MKKLQTLAAAAALALAGTAASASTYTFTFDGLNTGTDVVSGDYVFDYLRVVDGNCADGSCGAANNNEVSTLSLISGGLFDVTSMWFKLLGQGTDNTMTLSSDKNTTGYDFSVPTYDHNTGYTVDLSDTVYGGDFTGISWFQIASSQGGNVRFDDISVAPVPLPAAGLMLLAGIGGLAALRRRKAA